MAYSRPQLKTLTERLNEPRRFIQVILGPRQTGKTTMVQQYLSKAGAAGTHYATADELAASDGIWISQQWEAARIKYKSSSKKGLVFIIDEVQKVPDWSSAVKYEWDKDTREKINIKVVLLGSAQLTIQRGLSESLAGRFEVIRFPHWSLIEMQKAFKFTPDQFVWFGGYPGAAGLINDEARWKEYIKNSLIETTISKDIFMLAKIDKPALLKRLFELGCEYSGQILSFNKMLGQLRDAKNTTTLSNYLRLLGSAGLITGLEKYSKRKVVTRSSSPKLQVLNTAFISSQTNYNFKSVRRQPALWGRIIESAVGAHLHNSTAGKGINLYYWREGNNEVDFVLEMDDKIIAIEVKSSASGVKFNGMSTFAKKFNPYKTLLISPSGISWQEFLQTDPVTLF